MLTIKLVDAMGTKYLVGEYNLFVKDFLRRCMGEVHGVKDERPSYMVSMLEEAHKFHGENVAIVDIAGTVFTKPVWDELRRALENNYPALQLVDTEDVERNRFLYELCETLKRRDYCIERIGQPDLPSEELPLLPVEWNQLPQWLDSLRIDVVYRTVRYQDNPEVQSLILFMKPRVKLWAYNRTVFRYLAEKCADIMYDTDHYLYILSQTDEYWDARVDETGMVHIPNMEPMKRDDFLQKYLCIPAMFGRTYMEQANPKMKPAMKAIFRDVKALIEKQETTISSYYKEALDGHR